MNPLKRLLTPLTLSLLIVGGVGCDKNHSEKSTGEKLDQTMDSTSSMIEEKTDKSGMVMTDAAITAKVKAAILGEPGLQVFNIDVETKNGVTSLSGTVDSIANKENAAKVAENVEGVQSVNNKLMVKPKG